MKTKMCSQRKIHLSFKLTVTELSIFLFVPQSKQFIVLTLHTPFKTLRKLTVVLVCFKDEVFQKSQTIHWRAKQQDKNRTPVIKKVC